MEITVLEWR